MAQMRSAPGRSSPRPDWLAAVARRSAPSLTTARVGSRGATHSAVVVGAVLMVVGLVAFAALLDGVRESADVSLWDSPVLAWLLAHRSATTTVLLEAVSLVTEPTALAVAVALAVALLVWRSRRARPRQAPRAALLLGGAVALAVAASTVLKGVVGRARPPVADVLGRPETTYSFPSGHTLAAATVLLVAAYLVWSRHRTLRAALVALGWSLGGTGAVALSRLYLGYHWFSDVAASAAVAVVVLGLVVIIDARVAWPDPVVRDRALVRARVGRRR